MTGEEVTMYALWGLDSDNCLLILGEQLTSSWSNLLQQDN